MNRREALRTIGSGGALGGVLAVAVSLPPFAPTEAPAALASIEPDPLLAFLDEWAEGERLYSVLPDPECDEHYDRVVHPMAMRATLGELPAATTAAGAVAALRKALSMDDMDRQDANLIRAALAFLEGRGHGRT